MRVAPLLLLAAVVTAGERRIELIFQHLQFKDGVTFVEGTRGMGDAFPFVRGITPKTLAKSVGPITNVKQAAAAVRLFVAGPILRTQAEADRIVAVARKLRREFKHLPPKIVDHRPGSYAPTAKKVDGGFEVSLVAFEMDRNLQLVHVAAKVTRDGKVEIKRHHIVNGPMTSWQTAIMAMGDEEQMKETARTEREMRAEAALARKRYAQALKPRRDLDTAWAIARLGLSMREIEDLWGKPDWDGGSGLVLRKYDLADGTSVMFGAPGWKRACVYIRQMKDDKTLRTLYTR